MGDFRSNSHRRLFNTFTYDGDITDHKEAAASVLEGEANINPPSEATQLLNLKHHVVSPAACQKACSGLMISMPAGYSLNIAPPFAHHFLLPDSRLRPRGGRRTMPFRA